MGLGALPTKGGSDRRCNNDSLQILVLALDRRIPPIAALVKRRPNILEGSCRVRASLREIALPQHLSRLYYQDAQLRSREQRWSQCGHTTIYAQHIREQCSQLKFVMMITDTTFVNLYSCAINIYHTILIQTRKDGLQPLLRHRSGGFRTAAPIQNPFWSKRLTATDCRAERAVIAVQARTWNEGSNRIRAGCCRKRGAKSAPLGLARMAVSTVSTPSPRRLGRRAAHRATEGRVARKGPG